MLKLLAVRDDYVVPIAAGTAVLGILVFTWELIRLDEAERKAWHEAGESAIFVLVERTRNGFEASTPQFPGIRKLGKKAENVEREIREELVRMRSQAEDRGEQIPALEKYGLYV